MCDMKTVSEDHKICRGCLTSSRKLTSVAAGHFYYSLLTEEQKRDALTKPHIALCWECVALVRRTQTFQTQVRASHTIMENCLGLINLLSAKPSLSSLGTHHKLLYDAVFEEHIQKDQPLFSKKDEPEVNTEKIVIPTKYKTSVMTQEENAKNVEDIKVVEITTDSTDVKYEYSCDDSDSSDKYDDDINMTSSPKIIIKTPKSVQKAGINAEQSKKRIKNPIVRTPIIAKLEQELQKFMQNTNMETSEHIATNSLMKCDNVKENDDKEDDVVNSDKNKRERKYKEVDSESDSDFSLVEDGHEENGKPEHDSAEKLDNDNKKPRKKKRKYEKKMMICKNIADAVSNFTEVEMSVSDLKITLEKEDAIVDDKRPHRCSICGTSFRLHRMLTVHASRYHKATHRGQFRKGSFYNPPPTIPEKPCLWRCNICSRMFRREHTVAHVNECHRIQYYCTGPGCEWIQRGWRLKEDHAQHWETIHRRSTCDICGVSMTKKANLDLHMQQVHLKVLSLKCPHCEQIYNKVESLKQHVRYKHSAPEPAERRYCVECDVTYPTVQRLRVHFLQKHKKKKFNVKSRHRKLSCEECGRVMTRKDSYRRHYQFYHVGKTEYCCHICGKYLARKYALERHLDAHNNVKKPKTKPCTVCGRMFESNRVLRHHIYTHTGERPYKCEHCDAAYTQPYCLRVHLAKRHGVDKPVRENDAATSSDAATFSDLATSSDAQSQLNCQ